MCVCVCRVTYQEHICSSFPGVRASCCGGSSLHERLSLWAVSLLWESDAEHLHPPDPPLLLRTPSLHGHHCSAAPSAGHSDSVDDSFTNTISLALKLFSTLMECLYINWHCHYFHPYRLPCRLRVFRQKDRTCPSRRTAEKHESSVERRAEGKPSGQTPAHSSPLPQSSVSRMAKCCSITCWACWRDNNAHMWIHPLENINVLTRFQFEWSTSTQ